MKQADINQIIRQINVMKEKKVDSSKRTIKSSQGIMSVTEFSEQVTSELIPEK